MFQFLKSLLGPYGNGDRSADPASPDPVQAEVLAPEAQAMAIGPKSASAIAVLPESAPTPSLLPETFPSLSRVPAAPVVTHPAPAPAAVVATTPPLLSGAGIQRPKGRLERLLLPLKTITDRFPPELQPVLAMAPSPTVMVALSVETIMEQLPKGRVEVTVGELRAVAPVGAFVSDTSRDQERVELPLKEIFLKLNPTFLPRRTQRRIEVPEEIGGVFVKKPGLTRPTVDIPEASVVSSPPIPKPALEPVETIQEAVALHVPDPAPIKTESLHASAELQALFRSASKPEAVPVPIPFRTPPSPEPASPELKIYHDSPSAPLAPVSSVPPPPEPEPSPVARPVSVPIAPRPSSVVAPAPAPMAPVVPPAPAVAPAHGRTEGPTVAVPLEKISADWPQEIRDQIARLKPNLSVAFPAAALGDAVKSGKVIFAWEQIRWWVLPPVRISPSHLDAVLCELPLSVVAPLFTAAAGPARPARRMPMVDPPAGPQAFAPARQRPVEDATLPQIHDPGRHSESENNAERAPLQSIPFTESSHLPRIVGAPVRHEESLPAMLVERACALNGVSGAIVALAEGLLVAAKIPPEMKAETLAAFLPQVFSRVEQATGPMQIGELQSLMFTANERPWQIWKAGSLFFATMGRPHELLPTAQLRILVSQLTHQSRKEAEARRNTEVQKAS